jgi:hypothetical protein
MKRYPGDVELWPVAVRIENVRGAVARERKQPKLKQSPLVEALRRCLRELAKHRAALIRQAPPETVNALGYLDRMDATQRQLEKELDAHVLHRVNRALYLQEAIVDSWQRAHIPISRSVGPGNVEFGKPPDPLCQAVTLAFGLAGVNYSPRYVSDMLRDRAERHRSGKKGGREMPENPPT